MIDRRSECVNPYELPGHSRTRPPISLVRCRNSDVLTEQSIRDEKRDDSSNDTDSDRQDVSRTFRHWRSSGDGVRSRWSVHRGGVCLSLRRCRFNGRRFDRRRRCLRLLFPITHLLHFERLPIERIRLSHRFPGRFDFVWRQLGALRFRVELGRRSWCSLHVIGIRRRDCERLRRFRQKPRRHGSSG